MRKAVLFFFVVFLLPLSVFAAVRRRAVAPGHPTPQRGPSVGTFAVSDITSSSAVMNLEVSPNGWETTVQFIYGTEASKLNLSTQAQSVGSGRYLQSFRFNLTGLTANTAYYVQMIAENKFGMIMGPRVPLTFTTTAASSALTIWAETFAPDIADAAGPPFSEVTLKGIAYAEANGAFAQFILWSGDQEAAEGPRIYLEPGRPTELSAPVRAVSGGMSYSLCVWGDGASFCSVPLAIP